MFSRVGKEGKASKILKMNMTSYSKGAFEQSKPHTKASSMGHSSLLHGTGTSRAEGGNAMAQVPTGLKQNYSYIPEMRPKKANTNTHRPQQPASTNPTFNRVLNIYVRTIYTAYLFKYIICIDQYK